MLCLCEICNTVKNEIDMKDHDICESCFYSTERRMDEEIEKDRETIQGASKAGDAKGTTSPRALAGQGNLFQGSET